MNFELSNECGPLLESRLKAFEVTMGESFPSDYRQYLYNHNGGRPVKEHFILPDTFIILDQMYGFHNGPDYTQIDKVYNEFKPVLPTGYIPIGRDPAGNFYCIICLGHEKGFIYFYEQEGNNPMDNITLLAHSFTEFLHGLKDTPWE